MSDLENCSSKLALLSESMDVIRGPGYNCEYHFLRLYLFQKRVNCDYPDNVSMPTGSFLPDEENNINRGLAHEQLSVLRYASQYSFGWDFGGMGIKYLKWVGWIPLLAIPNPNFSKTRQDYLSYLILMAQI